MYNFKYLTMNKEIILDKQTGKVNRENLHHFVEDMYEYIRFVQYAYHTETEQELKIKGTLLHDLSGILSGDKDFIPRVHDMSINDLNNKL